MLVASCVLMNKLSASSSMVSNSMVGSPRKLQRLFIALRVKSISGLSTKP